MIVHAGIPFGHNGNEERLTVLSFRSKVMDVAAIFHGIMCDIWCYIGHGGSTWMKPDLVIIKALT